MRLLGAIFDMDGVLLDSNYIWRDLGARYLRSHGKEPEADLRSLLQPLTMEDYKRILTQPENALIRQYQLLLGVDGVSLEFADSALEAIAECAWQDNETSENIGARRLHTLMERILNDIAFNAGGGDAPEVCVHIDADYVHRMLGADIHRKDVRKYII